MSKRHLRKRRGRSTSPFVMLHWHLLDSQGWHQLSPHARLAYLELARLYNGGNNGRISLSARRLGACMPCDKATASRALRELDDAGFIETMRVGTFTRKDHLASEYRLCIYTCDVTDDLPNRRWNGLRWSPADGTTKSYHTGAQTGHKEADSASTVRADRTVKRQSAASTVRADRTHLESAMGEGLTDMLFRSSRGVAMVRRKIKLSKRPLLAPFPSRPTAAPPTSPIQAPPPFLTRMRSGKISLSCPTSFGA